jgi:DNA-binding transcriptional regulator YdaS (Cro superfamily)
MTVPAEDPLEDDDEITNEDTVLDVAIIPPLRLNIFETPMELSQSGIDALVKAMNEHATYRMQLYFRDTIYFFDKVEFEVLEVSTLRSGGSSNRRVFEREEEEVRAEWEQDSNVDRNEKGAIRRRKREVQQVNQQMYGTSILLGGFVRFSLFPSASSAECNAQLYAEMQRTWFMLNFINEQNHPELANVKQWLITTSKETEPPTPVPTPLASAMPSRSPSHSPTKMPTVGPTQKPSPSPTQSPTISNLPTQLYAPSERPSSIIKNDQINITPIIVASSLVSLFVFIGFGMFVKKSRSGKNNGGGKAKAMIGHRRLNDDDEDYMYDTFAADDPFVSNKIPPLLPTREESNSSDSNDVNDCCSEPSGVGSSTNPSVSSCQTMKINNVSDDVNDHEIMEKKWLSLSPSATTTPVTKGSSKPPIAPSSSQRPLLSASQQNDNSQNPTDVPMSPSHITLSAVGAASGAVASGVLVGPSLMKYFVKNSDTDTPSRKADLQASQGQKSSTSLASSRSSPITTVTPSKVSKEEFEKGWDVETSQKLNSGEKKEQQVTKKQDEEVMNTFSGFNEADGSFPSFEDNDQDANKHQESSKMMSPGRNNSIGVRSIGESTAYQSANEMHPLDWSNKGSDYDGTSIDESTFTGGDNTATREFNQVSWEQMNIDSSMGVSPLGTNRSGLTSSNYMTPTATGVRTPKSGLSDPSPSIGSYCESSPSSRGSSKQLINDLVWLEKKIADVRKRVDRLDDEGNTSTMHSPPISPESTKNRSSISSPISHNIICRDVIAPPGKLNIVIHSTKDGPAIHSVKQGSALEGKLFRGDLVVAVDDMDTRTLNAVDVMEMMAQKSDSERKITVIHCDNMI